MSKRRTKHRAFVVTNHTEANMLTTQLSTNTRNTSDGGDRAFFYVYGIPTNGLWLDLGRIDSWADVHKALTSTGVTTADYGGDVLVADVEGSLARACYSSRFDLIDLGAYLMLRDDVARMDAPDEAVAAFINCYDSWDPDAFESAYMAQYESEEAFAEQYIEDTGMLSEMPPHLAGYFDTAAFAHDLFMGDYFFEDGFVFCTNC